jgi:hypothetical protein
MYIVPRKKIWEERDKKELTYESSSILIEQGIVATSGIGKSLGHMIWRRVVRKALAQIQGLVLDCQLDVLDPLNESEKVILIKSVFFTIDKHIKRKSEHAN